MMGNYLRSMFVSATIFLLSIGCIRAQDTESTSLGRAPDFKLQDLSQNSVSLSNYKDKQPVIILFWTTWCPFCRKELRMLNQIYPDLLKDNLELLTVAVGEPEYKIDNFTKSYALRFKVLLDKDTEAAKVYSIIGVPTYVLVNKAGEIVYKDNYFPQEYKDLISK